MAGSAGGGGGGGGGGRATAVLREYYADNDFLSSPEGVMKLLAVPGCLAAGVVSLAGGGGGGCAGAAGLAAAGATVPFAAALLLALQLTGTLLAAPLYAPHAWLYADAVASAALGALLALGGVLSLTLCELRAATAYLHAGLAAINAALVVGAGAATYAAVTRRWDSARGPAREPRRVSPRDLDV